MTDLHERKDLRLLYCPFTLARSTYESDMETIEALYAMLMGQRHMRWFTHLMIVVRSWQESPDAIDSDVIKKLLHLCEFFDFPVIWGRKLWVSWPSDALEAPMPGAQAHVHGAYCAAAIANLKAEARSLGAAGTVLDAEPYAHSVQKGPLKGKVEGCSRRFIQGAIDEATDVTGQVDFIYPSASSNPTRYVWSMVGLGKLRLDSKTYYGLDAEAPVAAKPPEGVEHKLHVWGHSVSPEWTQVRDTKFYTLSPADVKAFDMARVRERFPENVGQWVYAADFAKTMKVWNR